MVALCGISNTHLLLECELDVGVAGLKARLLQRHHPFLVLMVDIAAVSLKANSWRFDSGCLKIG
jgi:hypothetical protein